ncbi:MAG TPA: tripartite tricarboxylate transporter substrate binding protein [Xanthobacteraceae bacterium]|jgi:tripartite-type tricarboxylate transporter receptor subunit TctC|nr:tripartite tricarboxylate transporter substrate binding protein [Xanthobacteraceae bacterium]
MLARRRLLGLAGLAAAAAIVPRLASADTYPSRPIRWIVPFPAGGSTDLIARLMGEWLAQKLGQPVVIENKPGGGTNIAVQAAVNAPADGYTLLFAVASNVINPSLYKSLPFDFQRDIAPVAGLAELPLVFDVTPALPATTVPEFIAYAKANPGKINFASFGARTISHLAIELFKIAAGIDVVHVPYQGGAPMLTDLLSGRIQAGIDALPNSLPHIKSGGVRGLAVLSAKRTQALPDLPTLGETISGFEVTPWTALGVPSGTSNEIVERLNREVNAGLADPGIKARLAEVGGVPLVYSVAHMRALIARDAAKWARVVEQAGIKPE